VTAAEARVHLAAALGGDEAAADAALAVLASCSARVVAFTDDEYPPGLRDLPDAPPFLYVRGTLVAGGTAVVGTRTASDAGLALAAELARTWPAPIVAGLARGIDAAAHRAAIERGVPTIAYVGNGIGVTYPPEHSDLEDAIVAAGGAIVSERLPGAAVTNRGLVRRDRLQAAHATAVILVESELSGGAMHTMRYAARLGRSRYALAPRGDDPLTAGNARAITEGALVREVLPRRA
jgi:DNA processing protein